ncbi:MAG: NADH-quinone oxidoreductase subunit NuoH [bacterium]|nr:NADH-quinone oxidoreductase subunit NuoH [bacterium]
MGVIVALLLLILESLLIFVFILLFCVAYIILAERKILGHMQGRFGPMHTGWHGMLQPIADILKCLIKENIMPTAADKIVFILAPVMSILPAIMCLAVIPFSKNIYAADLNIGVLYLLALGSLGVYGVATCGWAGNSKYGLLGSIRSTAQLISYEVPMGLAVLGPVMMARSLNLIKIVEAQKSFWYILIQPVGFFIFVVCSAAETNRIPFDLPEAETELVAGFHVEYSGFKFVAFFLAEYMHMFVTSAMAAILFLGGWKGPFFPGPIWFMIKVYSFLVLYIWARGTFPRYRYDQLMQLGWKFLLPLSLANLVLTSIGIVIFG